MLNKQEKERMYLYAIGDVIHLSRNIEVEITLSDSIEITTIKKNTPFKIECISYSSKYAEPYYTANLHNNKFGKIDVNLSQTELFQLDSRWSKQQRNLIEFISYFERNQKTKEPFSFHY